MSCKLENNMDITMMAELSAAYIRIEVTGDIKRLVCCVMMRCNHATEQMNCALAVFI